MASTTFVDGITVIPTPWLQDVNDEIYNPAKASALGLGKIKVGTGLSIALDGTLSTTNVSTVSVISANGFSGTVATATTTPAITLGTTIAGLLKGNATAISAAVVGTDYSVGTGSLATGILKSTTTSGALSIAANSDLPSMTATVGGAVPTPPNDTVSFLRGDGTWATPAGSGDMSLASVQTVTGAKTFGTIGGAVGKFILAGSTSGSTIVNASPVAGSTTMVMPLTSDTLIGKATTDVLTNKTFDTAGTGNVFKINGVTVAPAASGANTDITSLGNLTSTVYTTGGTATAFTITAVPAIAAYAIGQAWMVNFNAAAGAAPTFAVNGVATPPNLVKENADGTFSNIAANDFPSGHRSKVILISTTQALVERIGPFNSLIRLNTGNGVGGTLVAIRRFTNTGVSQGSDITYADSAANGALFTINTAGIYSINFTDQFNGTGYVGISLNTSNGATAIVSVAVGERLAVTTTPSVNNPAACSWTGYLASGSLIRAHTHANAVDGATPALTAFSIARVG